MAKIEKGGSAVALVSTLTLEEIRLLEEYRPKALVLREDDEEIFRVQTGNEGSVSQFGVCFATATRDAAAKAEVTLTMPADVTDVKAFAVGKIGPAYLLLGRVEEQATQALTKIKQELDQVRAAVSPAQPE